jgi:hypothetical protein
MFCDVVTEFNAVPVTVLRLVEVKPDTITMLLVVAQLTNNLLLGHFISNNPPK